MIGPTRYKFWTSESIANRFFSFDRVFSLFFFDLFVNFRVLREERTICFRSDGEFDVWKEGQRGGVGQRRAIRDSAEVVQTGCKDLSPIRLPQGVQEAVGLCLFLALSANNSSRFVTFEILTLAPVCLNPRILLTFLPEPEKWRQRPKITRGCGFLLTNLLLSKTDNTKKKLFCRDFSITTLFSIILFQSIFEGFNYKPTINII